MEIPRYWKMVSGMFPDNLGTQTQLVVWGGGEDEAAAERDGLARIERQAARLKAGEPLDRFYEYAVRAVREEVIQTFDAYHGNPETQVAVVTRNGYGSLVLNTSSMLFLDVDFEVSLGGLVRGLFSKQSPEQHRLEQLKRVLESHRDGQFRIYRTAGGLRVIGLGRNYDPAGREAEDLMKATGTDRCFVRLCRVQKCFRARLTPKPWRCGVPRPWIRYPYRTTEEAEAMKKWIEDYEKQAAHYATCQFIEAVGNPAPVGDEQILLDLHDQITRAESGLPLA
ncbi:MAG: hypothetical protein ACKO9H_15050 [Planctomycetota bacterium]